MKKRYEETITNLYDENNEIISSTNFVLPILIPEQGEAIRNKITGEIIYGEVGLGTEDSESNYEVVEIPQE